MDEAEAAILKWQRGMVSQHRNMLLNLKMKIKKVEMEANTKDEVTHKQQEIVIGSLLEHSNG